MRFATTLAIGAVAAATSVAASDAYGYRFNGEAGDVARRAFEDDSQELWARAPPSAGLASAGPATPATPRTPGTPATPATPGTPATPKSAAGHGGQLKKMLAKIQQESTNGGYYQAVCQSHGTGSRFLFHGGQLIHKQAMPHASLVSSKNIKGLSLNTKAAHKHRSKHSAHTPATPGSSASTASAPGTPRSALSQPATPSTAGSAPGTPSTAGTPRTPGTPATPATPHSAASHRSNKSARKGRKGKGKGKGKKAMCITWQVDNKTVQLIEQHMQAQKAAAAGGADPAAAQRH